MMVGEETEIKKGVWSFPRREVGRRNGVWRRLIGMVEEVRKKDGLWIKGISDKVICSGLSRCTRVRGAGIRIKSEGFVACATTLLCKAFY